MHSPYHIKILLDQLNNLHQGSMSVQDYTMKFDDLTLRCEVEEDLRQAFSRSHTGFEA